MNRLAVMLWGLAFAATIGAAKAGGPPLLRHSRSNPAIIKQWTDRLHVASEKLKGGDWKKGRDIADSLLREMRERIAGGEGTGDLLAVALLFRAIGESGLGRVEDAAWDFSSAQSFYPAYEKVDLRPYGSAGTALESYRFLKGRPVIPEDAAKRGDASEPWETPPGKLSGDVPGFPYAKAASCAEMLPVSIMAFIDAEGRPSLPTVAAGSDPILALAALDSFRGWRFEPARREGRPVSVFFRFTVEFKRDVCR